MAMPSTYVNPRDMSFPPRTLFWLGSKMTSKRTPGAGGQSTRLNLIRSHQLGRGLDQGRVLGMHLLDQPADRVARHRLIELEPRPARVIAHGRVRHHGLEGGAQDRQRLAREGGRPE